MRLAKPVKMQNETGTVCGYINTLPVDGCVYIITTVPPVHKGGVYSTHEVPVDDLDTFSQNVVYQLIKRARKNND